MSGVFTRVTGAFTRPQPVRELDFDVFYGASFQPLTLQLYAYLGDLGDAQDVVQEAFCRAYTRWKTVGTYENPVAWVRKVAWNLATSRFRRQKVAMNFLRKQREEHVEEPGPDRVALTRALATLPETHRRAVVLHYMGQLPISEIAEQMGAPEGTVKSWLSRGRAALAAQLKGVRENNDV
ncbi:RNA polymerase sigma-70 factor (ECF subfamily) [Allocatelliglobosispora scoriae]|uniref:RNA polymerase sigma-70 factor (ECF subfamily) n=1 Tax=Allocatelliglobosispora scoriae TaxID=643052 RepID=A0A841BV49_9ACTN|nr:SigE family RNA polymerase sigma factor [Allocatelliglobosispora scoriae]MBB5871039.1 RNA polymerase sigma-70 factor (ECF subfamily) [Allocatelliglobosispora scoriae]